MLDEHRRSARNPLRIAVVSQYFHPEDFRINDLVTELAARGHDVHVLTGNPNYPSGRFASGYGGIRPRRERYGDVKVVRVPLAARGNGSGLRLVINFVTFAISSSLLGPFYLRGKFDVVFTYQVSPVTVAVPTLVLARLKRAASVMWVQDLWPETLLAMGVFNGRIMRRVVTKATSFLHRGMTRILIQTPVFRTSIEQQGVNSDRIVYVPNWAEAHFEPVAVPQDAPERQEFRPGFNVLFAGNIGDAQGIDTIVGAMKELSDLDDLHWIVLGDGRRSSWLRSQVAASDHPERVHLLGRKPLESMPTWFALADVLVATLKADPVFRSTIPSKLQSYLACGRPIVAGMDGEGARVIDDSQSGATAPAGDAKALAAAVRRIYDSSSEERATMSANARSYYLTHFERNEVISTIEEIFVEEAETQQGKARR